MYCRNCGSEVHEKAIACPKCGVNPRSEKKFCNSCGVETNPNQVICVKCGVSLKSQGFSIDTSKVGESLQNLKVDELFKGKSRTYLLVAVGLMVISVFFPWVEVSSSYSSSGFSYGDYDIPGQSGSFSSGGISGISTGGGIFGLLLALAGGFMAIKNIKWAFIAGAINFIDGLAYIFGWFNAGGEGKFNQSFGSGSTSVDVDPKFGLYLFVLSSLVFAIFAFISIYKENTKEN